MTVAGVKYRDTSCQAADSRHLGVLPVPRLIDRMAGSVAERPEWLICACDFVRAVWLAVVRIRRSGRSCSVAAITLRHDPLAVAAARGRRYCRLAGNRRRMPCGA